MKDEIKEKIKAYYISNDIDKILDYITNLQEENEFLKLNNPEQNMEHFRIVKENKRKIDNLRKENEKVHKELDYADNYNIYLISKIDKAIDKISKLKPFIPNEIPSWLDELENILNGDDEEC